MVFKSFMPTTQTSKRKVKDKMKFQQKKNMAVIKIVLIIPKKIVNKKFE